jgi:hypothetical protein
MNDYVKILLKVQSIMVQEVICQLLEVEARVRTLSVNVEFVVDKVVLG